MRLLLSLLFFCIIFENVTLKELNLQRKLQQVEEDNTDITSDDAEGPNYPVSVNTTKNTGPVSTTNKLASENLVIIVVSAIPKIGGQSNITIS